MHESLNLFKEVAGNPIFEKTPMFVFLNKKDLFEDMITTKVSRKSEKRETDRSRIYPMILLGGKGRGSVGMRK